MVLDEVFLSLQGETEYVGIPFLFIRFSGCNLRCTYCDTKAALTQSAFCRVHLPDYQDTLPNPVEVRTLTPFLKPYEKYWISFTGGEPLLQSEGIEAILKSLSHFRVWIETNGTLPDTLSPFLLHHVDVWSIDIKLSSVIEKDLREVQQSFFQRVARGGRKIILKIVLAQETSLHELEEFWLIFQKWKESFPYISLVFQPVTLQRRVILGETFFWAYEKTLSFSDGSVRIIPQIHPILDIL